MSECASGGPRCAGNKKNHQRNSCNKNQSERREKAPRGAPTGRAPATLLHSLPPTYLPILHPLPSLIHTYTTYNYLLFYAALTLY